MIGLNVQLLMKIVWNYFINTLLKKGEFVLTGPYAYKPHDEEKDEDGVWIAYEDPQSAASKATYVRNKGKSLWQHETARTHRSLFF